MAVVTNEPWTCVTSNRVDSSGDNAPKAFSAVMTVSSLHPVILIHRGRILDCNLRMRHFPKRTLLRAVRLTSEPFEVGVLNSA
jgi:hypothetical protein